MDIQCTNVPIRAKKPTSIATKLAVLWARGLCRSPIFTSRANKTTSSLNVEYEQQHTFSHPAYTKQDSAKSRP